MSIKSDMKMCYICRRPYLLDPANPIKGCPYCMKRREKYIEDIKGIAEGFKDKIFGKDSTG